MVQRRQLTIRAMLFYLQPYFAEVDADLLAIGAIVIVGLLTWEFIRDWRQRKARKSRAERGRPRKDN